MVTQYSCYTEVNYANIQVNISQDCKISAGREYKEHIYQM